MNFVGRQRETKQMIKALEQGHHIVLTGKYGIGRTSLIRHVADLTKERWKFIFLDYAQTPGKVTKQLLSALFPEEQTGKHPVFRYKPGRFLIVNRTPKDKRRHVVVLDNIAKLTAPKRQFIRHLLEHADFQFIAITENGLPKEDLFRLRAALFPAQMMILTYLNEGNTEQLIRELADKYAFRWSELRLHMLAHATRGYPLGVYEAIRGELEKRNRDAFRSSEKPKRQVP